MIQNTAVALLLEDEPLIALDLQLALDDAGFAVTALLSGAAAHEWLEAKRPDVAIVDVELQDGFCTTVVAKLVADNVPFIVHSGDLPSAFKGTPFASGTWMSKPTPASQLVEAARALIT